jgi:predicted amidohydrolase
LIPMDDGSVGNVSDVFDPNGKRAVRQQKVKLTRYEREMWKLAQGNGLDIADELPMGVTICYDCEFPESGRILAERGVLLQCVPAFTETMHGFHRVRHSCHARAIENQNFVVHSSLVGSLGREPAPAAMGSSAIIAPSIEPFPADGILAETQMNEEGIAIAVLDFNQLARSRESGDVRNWQERDARPWESD